MNILTTLYNKSEYPYKLLNKSKYYVMFVKFN